MRQNMIREESTRRGVRARLRQAGMLGLLLPGLLLLPACGEEDGAGNPESDQEVEYREARTEPAEFRQTLDSELALEPAADEIAEDKPVAKTPDGKIAPYGIESARIVFDIKGDRAGRMVQEFDRYGLVDRRHDSSVALKSNDMGGSINELAITNLETMGSYDLNQKSGWAIPNSFQQDVAEGADGTPFSSGIEYFKEVTGAKKLGDTTINGYKTQVYRIEGGPIVQTIWMWRNVPIRFHYFVPMEDLEWRYEPVSITLDPEFPTGHFEYPKEYNIRLQAAPPRGGLAPPPPELVREGDLPEGARVEGE